MPEIVERLSLPYENLSAKWTQSTPNYSKQYCNIYLIRLKKMSKLLEDRIEKKWGKTYPVCQLHKLSAEKYGKCVVIGTLFKNQKLKPSILKRLAEGNQLVPQPVLTHFTDKSDELFIEDELQRYQLIGMVLILACDLFILYSYCVGGLECANLVTGISCALLGTDDGKGRFTVENYVFADYRQQIPRPVFDNSAYIVFISGLDLINSANFAINLQLIVYWLSGMTGDLNNIETSKVNRLVISGNSIRNIPEEAKSSISMLSRKPESSDTIEAVKVLDKFLLQLSQVIDVDLMPGENDPSNHILPQKAMHYCMFPQASQYKSLNQVSNPYYFTVGGLRVLGTSGQPVCDVLKYSEIQGPLEVLECCLKWGHLAPTAPDTLGCFPFYETDPFIMEDCPHVFFAGNQKEFATKECTGRIKRTKSGVISVSNIVLWKFATYNT
jgi:DNA polymerase delta subunit 2